jgi:hypothetical protein
MLDSSTLEGVGRALNAGRRTLQIPQPPNRLAAFRATAGMTPGAHLEAPCFNDWLTIRTSYGNDSRCITRE